MQRVLFSLPDEAESFLQTVLISSARFIPSSHPRRGFHHEVGDSLQGGLAFLEQHLPTEETYLMRLYASFQKDKALGCLVADGAEELFCWLQRHWVLQEGTLGPLLRFPGSWKNRDWGLVGIAYTGGIVLFDDDQEEPYRQDLDEGVVASYLPLGEEADVSFSPEAPTEVCLLALTKPLLGLLPEQEDEGNSST